MEAKVLRARLAARILLNKIWSLSKSSDRGEFLIGALDRASNNLELKVERVQAIFGDNQIAGLLDRQKKQIQIATKFSYTSQRFTLAHEIGHFLLHPGEIYFRDRELSAPGHHQEYYEVEADAFAAEFLMPQKYVEPVFLAMFSEPIDSASSCGEIIVSGRQRQKKETIYTPEEFGSLDPLSRATAIAETHTFRGRLFNPLAKQFNVSRKAMAIQLLQMGLVK